MIKKIVTAATAFALIASPAFAQSSSATTPSVDAVISQLKETPATQFELGLFKLELITFAAFGSIKGDRIGESRFDLTKVAVEENEGAIELTIRGEGPARHMGDDQCGLAKSFLEQRWDPSMVVSFFESNLVQDQLDVLKEAIQYRAVLASEENTSLTVEC